MKKTNRFLAMLLVVCTIVMMCMPLSALAATDNSINTMATYSSVVNGRNDGTWLFPLSSSSFQSITDWAGCPGRLTCPFCGVTHLQWAGDPNYSGSCYNVHSNDSLGHNGMDIGVSTGTNVLAPMSGYVYWSGIYTDGRGYTVILEHPIDSNRSYYAYFQHLSKWNVVQSGTYVDAGTVIALTGNSGYSTGAHLHYAAVIAKRGKGQQFADTINNSNPEYGIYGVELQGWATNSSCNLGRIVVNPMVGSPSKLIDSLTSLQVHCGSVKYTFNASEVNVTAPTPALEISGAVYPTGNLDHGKPFDLYGVISSPTKLTSVTVGIFTNDCNETSEVKTENPNSTTYNIRTQADADIKFNAITKAGYYRYKVIATNQTETKVLIDSQFTMGNPSRPDKPILSTSVNGKNVTVSWQSCSGATGYDISFFEKNNEDNMVHVKYGLTSTSYTTTLDPGEYKVHVAAINSNMTACWNFSDWAYFTIPQIASTVNIGTILEIGSGEFKYTAPGADRAQKVYLEDVLIARVTIDSYDVCYGKTVLKFDDSLTYAGYRTDIFGSNSVLEPTLDFGTPGKITVAMAGSSNIDDLGTYLWVAFTYDKIALSEKTVTVTCEIPELYNEDGYSCNVIITDGSYTFPAATHTVTFKDWDGTVLKTQTVEHGASATAPAAPTRPGYAFTGWDKSFTNVTSDLVVTAQYVLIQTNANIVVTSVEGKPGETVRVPIMIEENPGIMAIGIDVAYDASVLELVGTEKGDIFTGNVFEVPSQNLTDNPYRYTVTDATNEYSTDGTLVTYIFKIKEGAQPGKTTALELSIPFAYNLAEQQVYFNANSGAVRIIPPINVYTVTFKDWDGTVLKTQEVNEGESATAPANPTRPGYVFTGWDKDFTNVHSDLVVTAKYRLANGAELTVQSKTSQAGQIVEIAVEITKNPGIMYLRVTPDYDKNYLTLTGVKNGNVFPDNAFSYDTNVTFDVMSNNTANGTLLIMTFKVADNAPEDSYEVGITVRECYNYNEDDVYVTSVNGAITVSSILYGDVNGDGVIDGKDVIRLRKYLAAFDDETGTSTVEIGAGADCNGDGKVDGKDLVRLRKYLAAYDDDTGTSPVHLGPEN